MAVIAMAAGARAAPVAGWLVDPEINSSTITAGAATDSPVIGSGASDSADQVAIYASIAGPLDGAPDVTLNVGEQVTLSGSVTLVGITSSMNQFRFGLYMEDGPTIDHAGWLGYVANNSSGATGGSLVSRSPTGTGFETTTFASTSNGLGVNLQTAQDGGSFTSDTYQFSLTVARRDPVNLTINASLTSESGWSQRWIDAIESNPLRITYNFNRVGFLSGDSMNADQVAFSGIDVTKVQIPVAQALTLRVTTSGPNAGAVRIVNPLGQSVAIDYYEIVSDHASLDAAGWSSFDDHEGGDPATAGWDEALSANQRILTEVSFHSSKAFAPGQTASLGRAFNVASQPDLEFWYRVVGSAELARGAVVYAPGGPAGDFDGDSDVDASDLVQWSYSYGVDGGSDADGDRDSDGSDFLSWQRALGVPAMATSSSVGIPEPGSALLASVAVFFLSHGRRSLPRRTKVA